MDGGTIQAERIEGCLDDLIDFLGKSYANLVSANSALTTVNSDIHEAHSYLCRRNSRRAVTGDPSEPRPQLATTTTTANRDAEVVDRAAAAAELPDEIEKILAKARRIVDPLSAKANAKSKAKAAKAAKGEDDRSKRDAAANENVKAAPLPRREERPAPPKPKPAVQLPPRIRELRKEALQGAELLLESGHFVARAPFSFRKRASHLFSDCPSPEDVGASGREDETSLAGALEDLMEREDELRVHLESVEGMTQSDRAMLRARMKELLERRRHLDARMARAKDYGQHWRSLSSSDRIGSDHSPIGGGAKGSKRGNPGGGAMSGITGSGKLNALSMSWVPGETISGIGAAEKVVHEILRKPPISVEEEDFKRKHEIVAKARGLLQQKILQIAIEGDFMRRILDEMEDLRGARGAVEGAMTMDDALTLERLVALSRFNRMLYLDPKSNLTQGFFFRQGEEAGEASSEDDGEEEEDDVEEESQ